MQELTPWSLGSPGRGILWNDGELQLWATPSRYEGPYHFDIEGTQPDRLADARLVVDDRGGTELLGTGLDDVGEKWPTIIAQQPDLRLTRVDEHWTANPEGDWNLEAMDTDDLFDGGRVAVVSPEKLPEQSSIRGVRDAIPPDWGLSTTPIADELPSGVSLRHLRRVAGSKLKWLLERGDKKLMTPEGIDFLGQLGKQVTRDEKIDALTPWLAREWKKGRIMHNKGAQFPTYHPDRGWETPLDAGKLSHWADWFHSNHPTRRGVDIMQLQANDMHNKINEWGEHMKAEAEARADVENEEQRNAGHVLHTFDDGWTVRDLSPEHLEWEGDRMASDEGYPICVGSHGYPEAVGRGDVKILSLRDEKGYPHVTTELSPTLYHDPMGDALLDYTNLHDGRPTYPPVVDKSNINQIQGKGNSIPSPEYQARMKEYFETMPEADRPIWEGEPVDHPKELAQHEYNDPRHPNRYNDQGGYTPHGDYGVKVIQDVDYDYLLDPESDKILDPYGPAWASSQFNGSAEENIDAVYKHALENNRIPEFAKAVQTWGDWSGEDLMRYEDMNLDNFTVPYPGESPEDAHEMGHRYPEFGDPAYDHEWFDSWQQHQEAYDNERDDLADSHEPSKAVNYMYKLINPHYDPVQGEYANGWYSHPIDQMRSHPGLDDFANKMGGQPRGWKRTADTLNQMGDQPVDFCPWCQREGYWIQLVQGDAAHLKCPNCMRQYHPDDVRLQAPDFGYRGPQTNPRWNSHTNEALGGDESDRWQYTDDRDLRGSHVGVVSTEVSRVNASADNFISGELGSEASVTEGHNSHVGDAPSRNEPDGWFFDSALNLSETMEVTSATETKIAAIRPTSGVVEATVFTGVEGSSSLRARPLHSDSHESLGGSKMHGWGGLEPTHVEGSLFGVVEVDSEQVNYAIESKARRTDTEMIDGHEIGATAPYVTKDTSPGILNEFGFGNAHANSLSTASLSQQAQSNLPEPDHLRFSTKMPRQASQESRQVAQGQGSWAFQASSEHDHSHSSAIEDVDGVPSHTSPGYSEGGRLAHSNSDVSHQERTGFDDRGDSSPEVVDNRWHIGHAESRTQPWGQRLQCSDPQDYTMGQGEHAHRHGMRLLNDASSPNNTTQGFTPPRPQIIEIKHEGYSVDHPEGGQYFPSEEESWGGATKGHTVRRPFFVAQDKVYLGEADSYHDDLAEHALNQGHNIPEGASRGGYGWSDNPHEVNWFDKRLKPEWQRAAEQALHAHHGYEEPTWMLSNHASINQSDWRIAPVAGMSEEYGSNVSTTPLRSIGEDNSEVTARDATKLDPAAAFTPKNEWTNDRTHESTIAAGLPADFKFPYKVMCDRCWAEYDNNLEACPRCGTPRKLAGNQMDGGSQRLHRVG